jgi:taurine dioxygenase
MQVKPLTPTIGAVVEGVDLGQGVSGDLAGAIREALLKHQVLFFED